MPTDVNPEANTRPHATHLELQCTDKSTQLTNLNYPVRKVFDWSSQTCNDVVFTIEIGTMVLTKKYSGEMGFPLFLSDFGSGTRRLYPKDFPENEAALKRENIQYIQVNYQIEGHEPVIAFYRKALRAQKAAAKVPKAPQGAGYTESAKECCPMLGSLKSTPVWKWAAFGKHPVAGDYFNAGPNDPFFQAFSGWVENGYRQVSSGAQECHGPLFLAVLGKGPSKGFVDVAAWGGTVSTRSVAPIP